MARSDGMMTLGAWLLGAGILLALLDEVTLFSVFQDTSELLVFAGVGVLVIGAFRKHSGSNQAASQQNQQAPAPQAQGLAPDEAALRCPDCASLSPMKASYCRSCGHAFAGSQADEG